MTGYFGDLDKKQTGCLAQLRSKIADLSYPDDLQSDVFLLRWLRARDFDVPKTEKMLRTSLHWRQTEGMDEALETYVISDSIKRYYPGGFYGTDREGYPIRYDPLGHLDPKGFFRIAPYRELVMSRLIQFERGLRSLTSEASAKCGRPIDSVVVILDMERLSRHHLNRNMTADFIAMAKYMEANYPESMHRCIVLNPPALFPVAYNLVSPFLHPATLKKVVILGSNFKTELLRYVDADQLPEYYGGTLVDSQGNQDCREFISWGGEIPASCYLQLENLDGFTETVVERGQHLTLEYKVEAAGYGLQWEFQTQGHDIKFGVFRKRPKGSKDRLEAVVPSDRIASHLTCIKGEAELPQPGLYLVRFDNCYSWTKSKKLTYKVDLYQVDHKVNHKVLECHARVVITQDDCPSERDRSSSAVDGERSDMDPGVGEADRHRSASVDDVLQ